MRLSLKARSPAPPPASGRGRVALGRDRADEPTLGRTRRGHPVPAGGAVADYDDADHAEAAARHAHAGAHHEAAAAGGSATSDWREDERRDIAAARHRTLADHHHDLAQLHLTAGGRAASTSLELRDGEPALGEATPVTSEDRKAAVAELQKRSSRLPASLEDVDTKAYAALAKGAT